jgi:hypothetical protein
MRYFGSIGIADCPRVATPIGEPCSRCGELIAARDSGVMMPHADANGTCTQRPLHYECLMRGMIGSVAHQMKRCSCFVPGSNEEDDPRLTQRQSAELATALWYYRARQ